MKDYLPTRMRRRRKTAKPRAELFELECELFGAGAMDFTPEQLRDFLGGDLSEVEADSEFKERLRKKLWEIVRLQYGPRSPEREH